MSQEISLEKLHQAVLAQSRILAEMLGNQSDGDLSLTPDDGYEMLDHCLHGVPEDVRKTYFAPLDRHFPRHSSQQDD